MIDHWTFTHDDQLRFAELSGDWNPVHLDSVAARRTLFGTPIVHGIHLLMRGLDCMAAKTDGSIPLQRVRVRFLKPVRPGEIVSFRMIGEGRQARIRVMVNDVLRADIVAELDRPDPRAKVATELPTTLPAMQCCEQGLTELAHARGTLALCLDPDRLESMFKHCWHGLPLIQAATLLATSRLVGMMCPGLHSLYSGLALRFHDSVEGNAEIAYHVTKTDDRFSMAEIAVRGPAADGTIQAFLRPVPARQASYQYVKSRVSADAFAGQRALIVGGSRGLGEATAKIIAAGGGDVRLTFNLGEEDAQRVVEEIHVGGGLAQSGHLDVTAPAENLTRLTVEKWCPTHLYYFATPPIFVSDGSPFSPAVFEQFSIYYVTAFYRLVEAVRELARGSLVVLYPSSVALDGVHSGMAEYASAKAAGETLCAHLASVLKCTTFQIVRLPRARTDQTASVNPIPAEEPVDVMLKALGVTSCT